MNIVKKAINKLVLEYMLRNNAIIEIGGFTVRAFTTGFYNNVVKPGIQEEIESQFYEEVLK